MMNTYRRLLVATDFSAPGNCTVRVAHGRDGIEGLMLGSVTEAIVKGSLCSVLIVKNIVESMEFG